MSWKSRATLINDEESNSKSSWKDRAKPVEDEISALESFQRGAAQGVTFGFSDEITGALEAAFTNKSYEQARDESREQNRLAQEANLAPYLGGNLGGGAATAFIPGLNVAKAATMGGRLQMSTGLGQASGIGFSDQNNASDLQKDAAIGGVIGGGFQLVGEGVSKGIQAGKDKIKQIKADQIIKRKNQILAQGEAEVQKIPPSTKKLIQAIGKTDDAFDRLKKASFFQQEKASSYVPKDSDSFLDLMLAKAGVTLEVPEDATMAYLKNADVLKKAPSFEDTAAAVFDDILPQFKEKLQQADDIAWKKLSTNPEIPKDQIMEIADDFIQKVLKGKNNNLTRSSPVGADVQIINALQNELDNIKTAYGDKLSQSDLKSIVQSLQKLGYSLEGSPKSTLQGIKIRELSGAYNEVLKTMNPAYKKAMEPVAEMQDILQKFEKSFINQADPTSMDKFIQKAGRLHKQKDSSTLMQGLRGVDKIIDGGIEDSIKERLLLDAFKGGRTNGSRNTLAFGGSQAALGAIVGGPVGGVGGGLVGAVGGFVMDKYSGPIFKLLLDGRIMAGEALKGIEPIYGSRIAKVLVDAATRGNKALAATHFLLSERDPEYQATLRKLKEEENE